ncbi:DUF11 domain-containing protein [bacterium]|nr:DUF11 domain-containing protein [bacterium]NCQ55222.1 DUF11 domain-containing protein [Candidatus Parcubacteria bacterium]NCS67265.1 DUF11 domain-containing protein [Candidatus Peregrinibacteria bacterium]NCS96520.1 DUF11 domain-containing protein [bacterium]
MRYVSKQMITSLMLSLFVGGLFVAQVEAGTYSAGQVFNHRHWIKNNNSCTIYITSITKSWTSTGNVIQRVDNRSGDTVTDSSTNQSGSFSYPVNNYALAPGAEVSAYLDFYTRSSTSGSVTTNVTFQYTSNCGPCQVSASHTSTITNPDPTVCTQSSFAKNSANPGESVNFTWNINNPNGQVRLTCGGAGQPGIFDANVPNSGTRSITVPANADSTDVISCSLRIGTTNLCGDNLTVNGTPDIQIIKTDQNSADQDGVQQNDSQTINSGGNAVFKITVRNNGSEPLKNVVISDTESPACNRTAAQTQSLYSGSTFAPGAQFSYNCTATGVTPASFVDGDNDISVTGKGNVSNQTVNDADPSVVLFKNIPPANVQILKWANNPNDKDGKPTGNNSTNDSQAINSNANAIFRIQVKNTANVALQNVRVNDENANECALTAAQVNQILTAGTSPKSSVTNVVKLSGTNNNNILEPNEGFEYDCTQPNVLDSYTNTAVVIGDPVNGDPSVSDDDPSEVVICNLEDCVTPPVTPSINIVKTDVNTNDQDDVQRNDTQTIDPGQQAVFEIKVTNNGKEALRNVVVTDPESPSCNRSATQTQALYPGLIFDRGESFIYTCSRANVSETTFVDGDNDSFVTGIGVKSGTTVNDEDPSVVVLTEDAPICGNGIVEAPEQCDLGSQNGQPGSACSATCTTNPVATCTGADFNPDAVLAGNTSVFNWTTINIANNLNLKCSGSSGFNLDVSVPANGSRNITVPSSAALGTDTNCELFNNGNKLTCEDTLHTRNSICGDGMVETGEMCDDGNTNNGDGCSNTCQLEPACVGTPFFAPNPTTPNSKSVFSWDTANTGVDVTLNCSGSAITNFTKTVPSNGTEEINVPITATNGSQATCRLVENGTNVPSCAATLDVDTGIGPFCGDGLVNQPSEQCDDGNTNNTDSCSNTCQNVLPPYAIDVLKWAANPNDKDGTTTGNNNTNDTQTVESVATNNLDNAVFRIQVTNVGQNALKNVKVNDANAAACALTPTQVREILNTGTSSKSTVRNVVIQTEVIKDDLLQPTERFRYDCLQAGTRDGYTNTAVAVGTPVNNSADVNDSDPSQVLVCNGSNCPPTGDQPKIKIVKTDENTTDFDTVQGNDTQLIATNTAAGFKITVTNNGAEPLKEVVVTDEESPACARTASQTQALYPGSVFDVGESFSYLCEKANANPGDFDGANGQGSVDGKNDARVDAKSTVDNQPVNDEDPSEVLFITQCTVAQGQITITKDDSTPGQPDTDGDDTQTIANGGTATFTISVANPGTSSISEVSVTDTLSPSCARSQSEFMTLLGNVGNNNNTLDPGEVITYTCTQTNVTASFTNTASVSGKVAAIPCIVSDDDTSAVVVTGGPGGFCGNGVVEAPEQCDDGNSIDNDSCSNTCTLPPTCANPPCGGGTPIDPSVGTCAFNTSTGAALCSPKKPVEDVSDPLWQAYRLCRDGINSPRHPITGTIAEACALDWAEDQGLLLCGPKVGGTIDPFQPLAGTFNQAEINAQCDPTFPPVPCTPVNTPCPECFKAGNSIVKQVRPGDLSQPLGTSATVAKGENAKYEVTVKVDGFDTSKFQIIDAQIRVYDQTIPTESGNIFNRKGIEDGDGNNTWLWCDENVLCPEFGEYFYLDLRNNISRNFVNEINAVGETELKVHYDMDTAVASTKDTANIKNVAYAMIYYTYINTVDSTTGNSIAGFGNNICQPTPPTKVSQLAQGTYGSVANVEIIRPFIKAKAGNAGYYGGGSTDKAFADQNNILSPTDPNQNYGLTLTDDTTVYTGAEQGDADDFAEFQDQKDDFYDNLDAATNGTVTIGGQTFSRVGDSEVYQFAGTTLDVSAVKDISKSATFILTNGNLTVNNNFAFTNAGVFAAFIVRNGDLLINKDVQTMQGMYLVEQGEIKSSPEPDVSMAQLKVSGNLFGDLGHLLAYRRYIGSGTNIEPSIEINFDLRLLNNTPPMLEQFLGEGWRQEIQD